MYFVLITLVSLFLSFLPTYVYCLNSSYIFSSHLFSFNIFVCHSLTILLKDNDAVRPKTQQGCRSCEWNIITILALKKYRLQIVLQIALVTVFIVFGHVQLCSQRGFVFAFFPVDNIFFCLSLFFLFLDSLVG